MSRSKKHTPVAGIAGDSDKQDKRLANRALRRSSKSQISAEPSIEDAVLPVLRDVSDVWSMSKDGKRRFDAEKHPKLLRK